LKILRRNNIPFLVELEMTLLGLLNSLVGLGLATGDVLLGLGHLLLVVSGAHTLHELLKVLGKFVHLGVVMASSVCRDVSSSFLSSCRIVLKPILSFGGNRGLVCEVVLAQRVTAVLGAEILGVPFPSIVITFEQEFLLPIYGLVISFLVVAAGFRLLRVVWETFIIIIQWISCAHLRIHNVASPPILGLLWQNVLECKSITA
jgi:hypothetical protein